MKAVTVTMQNLRLRDEEAAARSCRTVFAIYLHNVYNFLGKKKNPPLEHYKPGYELPFISQMGFVTGKGTQLNNFLKNDREKSNKTKKESNSKEFDSYPVFLKHTLMYTD